MDDEVGRTSTEKHGPGELMSWALGHPVELEARLEHLSIRREVSRGYLPPSS